MVTQNNATNEATQTWRFNIDKIIVPIKNKVQSSKLIDFFMISEVRRPCTRSAAGCAKTDDAAFKTGRFLTVLARSSIYIYIYIIRTNGVILTSPLVLKRKSRSSQRWLRWAADTILANWIFARFGLIFRWAPLDVLELTSRKLLIITLLLFEQMDRSLVEQATCCTQPHMLSELLNLWVPLHPAI